MKLFTQIITILGVLLTGIYSYFNNYPFEGVTGFLTFLIAFSSTFSISKPKQMNQSVGDHSKAYQSGRDINIKE